MNEFFDDDFDKYDLDGFDAAAFPARVPPAPARTAPRRITVAPGTTAAGCNDEQRLLLARLLQAHEVRLPLMTTGTASPATLARASIPGSMEAGNPQPEAAPSDWHAASLDDDFDPWDELARAPGRKSLRSMV